METESLALLFLASFLAATLSAIAGFGGALLLIPILANTVGIKAAIPVLTIAQVFGNASRVWFGRRQLQWKPITYFLLTAIPLAIAGSYGFTRVDGDNIKFGVGILLILIVVYRRTNIKSIALGEKGMLAAGMITGFLSGLAGSAGPLGAAFFLGLNLTPAAYIASEAFTALVMHLVKIVVYKRYSLIQLPELLLGVFAGIAMIFGSWAGKKIVSTLNRKTFVLLVEALLIISAFQLILKF
ncbi:MAG: sulfite exporter TauE/SafE family protein [Cytophagaceae bacterium]|nr:sulfite exporter TauE/SafE family protein [Cytophagaceae bacterium]MDW8457031.1 sulfite exporter TauE/SafE family protein [Cytophagaceae bacterium]